MWVRTGEERRGGEDEYKSTGCVVYQWMDAECFEGWEVPLGGE